MPPHSAARLAALTFFSPGPHPWLGFPTTSPTELQIGLHTMPQILIHRHNALTSRTPCFSPATLAAPLLPTSPRAPFPPPSLGHSARSFSFAVSRFSDSAVLATGRTGGQTECLPPYSSALGSASGDESGLTKPLPSENKGCELHHSNRGHSDSCLRHARADKRPEKQMVCAFMTSLVEAQESPPPTFIQGRAFCLVLFCLFFVGYSIIKLFSLVEN